MMDRPLTPLHFLERAATWFGSREVVEVVDVGDVAELGGVEIALRRTDWRGVAGEAARVPAALAALGVGEGDRVAVLAWNSVRHLALYFGIPRAGAITTMVNVRLGVPQVAAVLAHAEVTVVLAEGEFAPLVDQALVAAGLHPRKVALDGDGPDGWVAWDGVLDGAAGGPAPSWNGDEDAPAALCYTSGTTGDPKGVLYSHRALALHTLAIALPDGFSLGEPDVILPAVPMFHANAWGLPFAAAMTGAGLVLPGRRPRSNTLAALLADRQVTFAAGVPTVWMGVLDALRNRPRTLASGLRIHAGGAPSPPSLVEAYRKEFGVEIVTGWGMTELTPVGMVTHPRASMRGWDDAALLPVRTSQGTPLPFVEARMLDEAGRPVPRDGSTPGELQVRGPWVTAGYYRGGEAASVAFEDGWLRTGDVATVDPDGYVRLVDRTKDLIRSGGEWISSVTLEHALMDHPAVAEAAVVAVPDARWGERPLACIVRRDAGPRDGDLLESLEGRVPSWWIPERVVTLDAIPRTSTGKFDKKVLRERFAAVFADGQA